MKYLLKSVETYRVATESEAKALIEEAKNDRKFVLSKYLSEKREQKSKGEVIDDWIRVTLTKVFTDEKEPDATVEVTYSVDKGAFPDPVSYNDTDDEDDDEEGELEF